MRTGKDKPAKAFIVLLIAASCLAAASPTASQTQGSGGTWTQLGTVPAGAWNLVPDPSDANKLFALGLEGISRSTDGGKTWAVCSRRARMMRMVAPLPNEGGQPILYAVTPEGLQQSDDGCRTWRSIATDGVYPSGGYIRWLTPYPNNRQVLYAGMGGLGGLYRSTDAGATWQGASGGLLAGAWVTALTADPGRPERVLVGLRYTGQEHPPAYVYRSTDGGLTWRTSSLGMRLLPNNDGRVVDMAWAGDTLFAATSSDGLYRSTDRGESWQLATLPRRVGQPQPAANGAIPRQSLPLQLLKMESSLDGALLINTLQGAYQSLDGGRSWTGFGPGAEVGSNVMVAMDRNSGRVLLAGKSGIWGYKMPTGVASLPTPTPAALAELPPTPPPPPPPPEPPTSTPAPATATSVPQPTVVPVAAGTLPTDRAQPLDPSIATYFEESGHNVRHGFRAYWTENGGVGRFGFPLTEEFVENGVSVQYFERARLEYRDDKISVGRLGAELVAGLTGPAFRPIRFFPSEDNNVYFGPTQHSLSGPFLELWRENGGEAIFGYPLSESFKEQGSEFQWFERARLEWHSYLPQGERIVLGLIGKEALQKRGWLK